MKRTKSILSLSLLASLPLLTLAMTPQEMNQSLDAIRKKNNPRYLVFDNQKIVDEFLAFQKTNSFDDSLTVEFNRRLVESAALLDDASVFNGAIDTIKATTNTTLRTQTIKRIVRDFSHLYAGEKKWRLAMDLFDSEKAIFNDSEKLSSHCEFAVNATRAYDKDLYKSHVNALLAVKPDKEADLNNPKSNFNIRYRQTFASALANGLSVDREAVIKLFDQNKALFGDKEIDSFYKSLAQSYIEDKDRPAFDTILKMTKVYPIPRRISPYSQLIELLNGFDKEEATKLLEEELSNKALTPEERTRYLTTKRNLNTPATFNYGFNNEGEYNRFREVLREQLAIEDSNPSNNACRISNAGWMANCIERIIWFDDLKFANELLSRYLSHKPGDGVALGLLAQVKAIEGDAKGAIKCLSDRLGTRPNNTPEATNDTACIIAFLNGKGIKGFDAALKGLNLTDVQRLVYLRKTSRTLFKYQRWQDCKTIFNEIEKNVYRPVEKKIHIATYVPNCPKTADGFVRSSLYDQWEKMASSFYQYGDNYGESSSIDEKRHIKSVPPPETNKDYPTGIRVVYDEDGVHVFIRCDDPAIEDVKLGKRDGGGLEMFFAPGDLEVPYHSIFMEGLPKVDNPHDCEWSMPGRHYRRNVDIFTKDAVLTDKGIVAHLGFSWIAFYDNLPINGNLWNLGCLRSCPGGLLTIGGIVHELSRGLKLKFDLTKTELTALKRRTSIQAFNRYNELRNNEGKFIKRWNDPLLGDPDFYSAEVEPLLAELDEAGKKLLASCSDKEVEEIFAKYTPLWAEIQYEIAERRTRYLDNALFNLQ